MLYSWGKFNCFHLGSVCMYLLPLASNKYPLPHSLQSSSPFTQSQCTRCIHTHIHNYMIITIWCNSSKVCSIHMSAWCHVTTQGLCQWEMDEIQSLFNDLCFVLHIRLCPEIFMQCVKGYIWPCLFLLHVVMCISRYVVQFCGYEG